MLPRIYRARPRGIGIDPTPGCYVCGVIEQEMYHTNCSFFVPSRETGEAIVSMFSAGARLDYRYYEPDWIQVKVGVCDKHVSSLEKLVDLVAETQHREDGPGINKDMIERSKES